MNISTSSLSSRLPRLRLGYLVLSAMVLLAPLIAMPFTSEVNWGAGDFVLAAGLLGLLGLALEGAVRAPGSLGRRAGFAAVALAAFLLVWAELAVGLFD